MDNDLNVFGKWNTFSIQDPNWKTTSTFWQMEDDLNFWNMEDDLNSLENGRQPLFFGKMEDDPNFKVNERRPKF